MFWWYSATRACQRVVLVTVAGAEIAAALYVGLVTELLPRLSELAWDDLVALDEASRRIQEETQNLWRDVVSTAASHP